MKNSMRLIHVVGAAMEKSENSAQGEEKYVRNEGSGWKSNQFQCSCESWSMDFIGYRCHSMKQEQNARYTNMTNMNILNECWTLNSDFRLCYKKWRVESNLDLIDRPDERQNE